MNKLGIIFVSYRMPHMLADSLTPWITAKKERTANIDYVISAVSLPFAEYREMGTPEDIETPAVLATHLTNGDIDYLITEPKYIAEYDARTIACKQLIAAGCDYVAICDGDEIYTQESIAAIVQFVTLSPWHTWFRVCLKNYIFDRAHYLAEPFCPPRIAKVESGGYKLIS